MPTSLQGLYNKPAKEATHNLLLELNGTAHTHRQMI